jgi:hypothetical protein
MHSHTETKVTRTTLLKRMSLAVATLFCAYPASPGNFKKVDVPSVTQQIAAAILPLPPVMREHATVIGYAADYSLVTLRQGSNGMVCTGDMPGDDSFDARCYHESFMPIVRRMRDLYSQGKSQDEVYRTIDAEIKAKKLLIPDHPTAGYRMLGPIIAYHAETNTVDKEIESWQSVHFPYKTAAEIGFPEEGQVDRSMPYVMTSGTFWSHVMIEHEGMLNH